MGKPFEDGYTPVEPPQSTDEDRYDRMKAINPYPGMDDEPEKGFVERNNTHDRL